MKRMYAIANIHTCINVDILADLETEDRHAHLN
jgi:hypothetical protein